MKWYKKYLSVYGKPYDEMPAGVMEGIRERLRSLQSDIPLVSVVVIAYNEEKHLPACLWSLSESVCRYPMEFIGVDNDSGDRTGEIYAVSGIPYYTESRRSAGYARQCGLLQARGKYCVCIDSDTIYPPGYVETMVDMLRRRGVVAACSLWSYIPDREHSWFGLKFYELVRDVHLSLLFVKRPELCARGMVFAHDTERAKAIGYRGDIRRGEDGSMALGLKAYGRIGFVRRRKARAVTGSRSIGGDGSLAKSLGVRLIKSLRNAGSYFTKKDRYQDDESNLVR